MKHAFAPAAVVRVHIDDPFWNGILDRMHTVTLKDTLDKLEKDGVLRNFEKILSGGGAHEGMPWHTGLLFETVRGAAEYLKDHKDPALLDRLRAIAELTYRAQDAVGDGYISAFTLLDRPGQRFGEGGGSILWQHDLYNHGCLIEAGVAMREATGEDTLLRCAIRAADMLCDTIGPAPKKSIVPGHSLPEGALIELYHATGDKKYLDLAHFWVHERGRHERRANFPQYMGEYAQDHAPIEYQFQAVGHAVRASLYYAGAAMLALEEKDQALLGHCARLYDSVTGRKMHLTGGIGATEFEEKLGEDYDLRNDAYLETCAAAGMIRFAEAMGLATSDARAACYTERALYNAMLASVSQDGTKYFYKNPLTSRGGAHRWDWHICPCCPPMIHKTFSRLPEMILSGAGKYLQVRQYVAGTAEYMGRQIRMEGDYRRTGRFHIEAPGVPLMLRVPEWARETSYTQDGRPYYPEIQGGWALIPDGGEVACDFHIRPRRLRAHPYARADRNREAVCFGPLVYCLEGADNDGRTDRLIDSPIWQAEYRPGLLGGVTVLTARDARGEPITAVPYYAWDNRQSGSMDVWLPADRQDDWSTEGWGNALYREIE